MNSINIHSFLYSTVIFNTWLNCLSTSIEHYTIESHMHGEHLTINVTCLDAKGAGPTDNHMVKRSLSPYGTYKHDVPSSGLNAGDEHVLDGIEYGLPNSHKKDKMLNSLVKEGETNGDKSKKDEQHRSGDLLKIIHSHHKPNPNPQTILSIDCNFLEVGPNMLNSSIHKLKMKSTGTIKLTPDWAQNSPELTGLKIRSENGLELPPDCSWVPPLTHNLDLAYTPLNNFTLSDCPVALKRLQLQGTSLQSLSICVKFLEELNASWNTLSEEELAPDCAEMTRNLKQLKLHHNEISSWSFCEWPKLTHLELQNNNLQSINFTLCFPHSLLHLNLAHNKLMDPPLGYPPKLSYISLAHNRLKEISHLNRGIQEVDLSHNYLKAIGKGVFRSASALLSLDLSHNHLTILYGHDFTGLHALRYLDLSHNAITHIRHEALLPLRLIQELRINSNSLHQLDARLLANLPRKLLHFSVHDNPWRCSCHLLASLSKASTSRCRPNCREMPELTCRESKKDVTAQHVLRQCIEAVQETETVPSVYLLPSHRGSDEDTSEERVTGSGASSKYYAVIPVAVLFLATPIIAVGVRKLYLNRKRILRRCNCISSGPSDSESSNVRWSTQNGEHDTDSETEF